MFRILTVLLATSTLAAAGGHALKYQPAPVDNPLKGLVPYMGDHRDKFPHSLEFSYIPLSEIVTGKNHHDWSPVESRLQKINARGHQAIFRIYLEYPDQDSGVPEWLGMEIPDYESPALRSCLRNFIAAFGEKYDGDPRIGFLTAGLLGKWGEWHTHPEDDRWAGKETQTIVLDAYEAAFKKTPVLLRYPVGEGSSNAANHKRPFGYHDDSFAWATLDTGKEEDFWFYIPSLKKAGPAALTKWKNHPVGGEIRPEAWGAVFDKEPAVPGIQDFRQCVEESHATWLMDSGMFNEEHRTAARIARAKEEVRRLGYEFHVPVVRWKRSNEKITVSIDIENRGVAPFYAEWPVEWGLLRKGKVLGVIRTNDTLTRILPGEKTTLSCEIVSQEEETQLAIRVANPLVGGKPVRFANETQDAHVSEWLTLIPVP